MDNSISNETPLGVSRFDRVSAALSATAILLGVLVGLLMVIWATRSPRPIQLVPPMPLTGQPSAGELTSPLAFETPTSDEVDSLVEPNLAVTLVALTDVASQTSAAEFANQSEQPAGGAEQGGDRREAGPVGLGPGGEDIVPRFERWLLKFSSRDQQYYAEQLDYYGIELGVIGGSIQGVDYARRLAKEPIVRRAASQEEQRLYFMWTNHGPLRQYDRNLLRSAGVELEGRVTLMFIPRALENKLAAMELDFAREHGGLSLQQIGSTIFESRRTETGFQFVVVQQIRRAERN